MQIVRDKNQILNRHSVRLKEYDYSQAGVYFVTLCAKNRKSIFGDIIDGTMQTNETGLIIAATWQWLSEQYPYVRLDTWVVMPNHFHGIVFLLDDRRGGSRTAPTKRKPLGRLIGAFKTVSTKRINALRGTPGQPVWQRNYYEHVIRNEIDLEETREYIQNNPLKWLEDENHPANMEK
ncbi:MAG: transposase [Deltaproteobacteria bacterium]|nr:transposase [Deltaproteobacteria bacterium]